jgi:alkanesulfonate monooxygenase SsuD/methylene tetrahydromethanopterin reductase-like flavin-dependent oxidoreductase (luciferase family)
MDNVSRFGVFLPTYIWADDGPERARNIVRFAQRVEELGFDSLFVTDHLLSATHFYSASFLEPISTLAVAAGQYLSNNRFSLGVGVGWNQAEFLATGGDKSQRGKRSDELLDIALPLMEGETVTYHGKYFSVDEVSIEPQPERRPELWVGGGSQLANEKSPDKPALVPAVKRRILRGEGWIPRPTCPPEDQARDWAEIQEGLAEQGRDPASFTVAHENFMHFVDTADPVEARRQQHEAFLKVMSATRGPEYLESVYLFGTPEEIVASLQARVDAGIGYFMLHTMTPEIDQLDLWLRDIVPNVRFPEDAPAVRAA